MAYQHLRYEMTGAFAIINLDMADKSANVLSTQMISELQSLLIALESQSQIQAIILQSAKQSGFVFGADIGEFEVLKTQDDVRALQQKAMDLLSALEKSRLVSVAVLHGPVLGGGLELALACDYRLCLSTGRIMAGFPEANLGLIPGFAGTARAARLIGGENMLDLCLSAKPVTSQNAVLSLGLADALCETDMVLEAATSLIAKGKRHYDVFCDAGQWSEIIEQATGKYIVSKQPSHIPHLLAMIELVKTAGPDFDKLVAGELAHFPNLMLQEVSQNLRRVFALTDKVKKQARGASKIQKIQVIGAGAMGVDIASYFALKGFTVFLTDINQQALSKAERSASDLFTKKLEPVAAKDASDRLICTNALSQPEAIDLVIEAVSEKMALKQKIWQSVEADMRPDCLLATNSSALDLDQISHLMRDPGRLLGMHFFNPATIMPLVEVIYRDGNDEAQLNQLVQLSLQIGKMPVKVQNSPGFLVNRALLPYIFEAIEMMLSGSAPDEIDQALIAFGMPMGPIELADQIGLDICLDVGMRLGMSDNVKAFLQDKQDVGQLGRKTGKGIYQWDGKKAVRPRASYDSHAAAAVTAQVLQPMILACQASLDEGHISSADFVDAAMIFGVGFPRHTGGPLCYHASLIKGM
ncbi:MAG: 3-hydroxyacyl-CoA dehydrogenase NAD-binding domain-containing protein [Candidatus Puniceispirillaceae bacterium]